MKGLILKEVECQNYTGIFYDSGNPRAGISEGII
jgi:hypothetical protein